MIKLLLIRHAMTNAVGQSYSGTMGGVHLNEAGKLQAESIAARLAALPLAAVYTSPLERAQETARCIAEKHQLIARPSDSFTEIDCGEWTGKSFEQISHTVEFQRFNSFRSLSRPPGGELMLEAQARVITQIDKLKDLHQDQTIAIVTHADIIKAAVAYFTGIHLDMIHRIEISPASISIVQLWDDTACVLRLNDTVVTDDW